MTSSEVESYRRQLLALRDRLNRNVSHLSDEALEDNGGEGSNLSHVPLHLADLGSDSYARDNTLHLLASENQLLEETAAALERIERGAFGQCEQCRGPILPRA